MRSIMSHESMLAAVKKNGIIPFFKVGVPGWSIEEQTAPGYWFWEDEAESLGPWDWKVDVVQSGEIAYGKFLGGKAAFATVNFYRELMNWRRSLPKYQVASGRAGVDAENAAHGRACEKAERIALNRKLTTGEKTMGVLAPICLEAIREAGAMGMKELRTICIEKVGKRIPGTQLEIKKNVMDSVMAYLQMGTWTVIGDIERVYRGPSLTYSGWQRASNTTPDALFGLSQTPDVMPDPSDFIPGTPVMPNPSDVMPSTPVMPGPDRASKKPAPFWASIIEPEEAAPVVMRTPEESREFLIQHVMEMYPGAERKILEKVF